MTWDNLEMVLAEQCSQTGGFPGVSDSEDSAYNAQDPGWTNGLGKDPLEKGMGILPTPVFLPGRSRGLSQVGYSPWRAESQAPEQLALSHLHKESNSTSLLMKTAIE